jgi:hypothetical protein
MGARPIALMDSLRFGDIRKDGTRKGIKDAKPIVKELLKELDFTATV